MKVSNVNIVCKHAPGPTAGNMMYYMSAPPRDTATKFFYNRCVFTGDLISIGGIWTKFQSAITDSILKNLIWFRCLPKETNVFAGNEHTISNLTWA